MLGEQFLIFIGKYEQMANVMGHFHAIMTGTLISSLFLAISYSEQKIIFPRKKEKKPLLREGEVKFQKIDWFQLDRLMIEVSSIFLGVLLGLLPIWSKEFGAPVVYIIFIIMTQFFLTFIFSFASILLQLEWDHVVRWIAIFFTLSGGSTSIEALVIIVVPEPLTISFVLPWYVIATCLLISFLTWARRELRKRE